MRPAAAAASARPVAPAADHPRNGCPLVDPAALERFLDERLGAPIGEGLVPGAVFVAVQNGRQVLARGYGLGNVATGTPVSPTRTVFYAGSISKLITATAVVQLADRGLVDLDTDINRYLTKVQLDSVHYEPVTLRHLLTHTAGIDRRDIGMATRSRAGVMPLSEYLQSTPLPRVDPPGTAFRYSNRGIALAGLVVEEVSGQPFAAYVREHIFLPLGMTASTMDAHIPDADEAPGYTPLRGRAGWRERPPLWFHNAPAIGLRTTAADLGRFILAHLNGGVLDGQRILSDSATAMMWARQFSPDPRLAGSGLGFRYANRMGLRIVGHRGLVNDHASILDIVPGANAGYFVACNASDCARLEPMVDELLDRFFCGEEPGRDERPLTTPVRSASELAGTYRPKRHAVRNVERARALFDEFEMAASGDTLVVGLNIGQWRPQSFVPVASDEYAAVRGDARMLLIERPDGRRAVFFDGRGLPHEELVKLHPLETRAFFTHMSLWSAAGLASAVVLLPVMLIVRRRRGSPDARGAGRAAALAGVLASGVMLAFLLGMQRVLGGSIDSEFVFGVPPTVRLLLLLPVVGAVLSLPLPPLAVMLWRKRCWTVFERVYYSLMIVGLAGLFLLLDYWNLLGIAP